MVRAAAARARRGIQRLVHDATNGTHAAATLRAAAEAAINFTCPARRAVGDRATDIMVGQDVAGTDDHGKPRPSFC